MAAKFETDTLGMLIADVARRLRAAFERKITGAGFGVTPGEVRALIEVSATGGTKQAEIAGKLGVEPMTLCTYLDRLQSLGLVERQPDPADRRAKNVVTTGKADALLGDIRSELHDLMDNVTKGLSSEEIETLRAALKILRDNLKNSDCAAGGEDQGT